MRNVTILLAVVVMLAATAQAGVVSYAAINNDADSGVSSAKAYTHKLDFDSNPGVAALINGIQFDAMVAPRYNPAGGYARDYPTLQVRIDGSNAADMYYYPFMACMNPSTNGNDPGNPIATGQGLHDLMNDVMWQQGAATWYSYTLYGLTPGQLYEVRLYKRYGDTRGDGVQAIIKFDVDADDTIEDSVGLGFQEDDATVVPPGMGTAGQTYYISYQYTAGTSGELEIVCDSGSSDGLGFWTLGGISNEVVPEPATMVLLGLGGIGVLLRRRRK